MADSSWAHAIVVVCLLAFIVLGFGAVQPAEIAAKLDDVSPIDPRRLV